MSHRLRAAHFALLLVVLSAPVAATSGVVGGVDAQQTPPQTASSTASHTTILIQLRSDGNATFSITASGFDVASEQERDSFNTTAERFTEGEADTLGLSAFRRANTAASEATGRPMELRDVRRSSNLTNGTLTLSFTWTNFARSEGETQYVDDVYNTTDPWLTGLEADQTLILELPPDAVIRTVPKKVRNGQIVWEGPTTFTESELELAYNPGAEGPSGSPSPGAGPGEDPDGGLSLLWGGLALMGAVVAVSGVYVLLLRDDSVIDRDAFDGGPLAESDDDGDEPPASASTAAPTENDDAPDQEIDEELLSDEERVELLLERNGGRMKQANIVKETGWSNAKVSQLLSSMEEDGQIDKLRIGRENLISFPDEDVTDIEN
ncbi:hypothetical protein GOC74_06605 [Halomicrobium mukohataei]|uniref:HTH iclR-type domain-containing protein n=1 Tax=Halomicrobium mukohataei TaxID=57705 RepID=A0A847UBJ8_9EURY|nr:hypothetical protein [Halomicrobium mukohataei]NLV09597.1 hypothetical protein [Halomicrobium mukohataei]